jgi:hypothetical protein
MTKVHKYHITVNEEATMSIPTFMHPSVFHYLVTTIGEALCYEHVTPKIKNLMLPAVHGQY